jgi:hypothetical protein
LNGAVSDVDIVLTVLFLLGRFLLEAGVSVGDAIVSLLWNVWTEIGYDFDLAE